MIRTAILGASGYVGGELLRLIAAHPELRATKLFGDSKAGQALGAVHPHLAAAYPKAVVERFAKTRSTISTWSSPRFRMGTASGSRPHPRQRPSVRRPRRRFPARRAATYERWYGQPHEAPGLLGEFVYGIPELHREAIKPAKAVAAAGCTRPPRSWR